MIFRMGTIPTRQVAEPGGMLCLAFCDGSSGELLEIAQDRQSLCVVVIIVVVVLLAIVLVVVDSLYYYYCYYYYY